MLTQATPDGVTVRAPAKVNLHLEILGKRPDGYHELATLMLAVDLCDTLEFRDDPGGGIDLECDLPGLTVGPDNLVCRAAELVRRHAGRAGGVRARLTKRIPTAAGLAGGSADAAATLAGLNRLWRLNWDTPRLMGLAAELGSDVAFFFAAPMAWCTGRGEVVEPVPLGAPLHLVLVCPHAGLSTAAVYKALTVPERPLSGEAIRRALAAGDVEKVGRLLHNRLQPVAERLCPDVSRVLGHLAAADPAGCLMSGSGSAAFGLARDAADAERIARELLASREVKDSARVYVVRSCDRGATDTKENTCGHHGSADQAHG